MLHANFWLSSLPHTFSQIPPLESWVRHLYLEPIMAAKLNVPISLLVMSTNDSIYPAYAWTVSQAQCSLLLQLCLAEIQGRVYFHHQYLSALVLQQNHILLLNEHCTCGSLMALLENWFPMALSEVQHNCPLRDREWMKHQQFCISVCTKSISILQIGKVFRGHLELLNY